MAYDIIGDIHGQADKLEALLRTLGYRDTAGAWRHPERQAIFVGDFLDRGPAQVRSIDIARRMVDAGVALAVMGNHELNAIAWHTPDSRHPGDFLRSHFSAKWGDKNRKQHAAFLAEVEDKPALHAEIIDWFLTLPLWLELPDLLVVHACWHAPFMAWLAPQLHEQRYLTRELMVAATDEDEAEKDTATPSIFKAVECLTKGIEIPLPDWSSVSGQGWPHAAAGARALVGRGGHDVPQRRDAVPNGMRGTARPSDPRACANRADGQAGVLRPLLAHRHPSATNCPARLCGLQRRSWRSVGRLSI